ncbi:MAG: hypothetical protein JO256_05245 [Alphaproteobacteria bacterium]|nr:hypothetical protein [Alphaproteobacteria bacterium]
MRNVMMTNGQEARRGNKGTGEKTSYPKQASQPDRNSVPGQGSDGGNETRAQDQGGASPRG